MKLDLKKIADSAVESGQGIPVRKGRVLQLDADFLSFDCAHPDETIAHDVKRVRSKIKYLMAQCGAEFCNVHLTVGMKGGREQMASVKPYQEKRGADRDPAMTERKTALRNEMANFKFRTCKPVVNQFQEADDSLCQYQVKAIAKGELLNSVLMSGDKDLWMVPGWHCDYKTGRMWLVSGYGSTEYREVGNVKPKLVGEGTSWFWHQVLMGDTADTIPGLPKLSNRLMDRYLPLKAGKRKSGSIACGEAKAVAILDGVHDDRQAFQRVSEAYQETYGAGLWKAMFFEQAFLLWMRRTLDPLDVLDFLATVGFRYTLTEDQEQRMQRFKDFINLQLEMGD